MSFTKLILVINPGSTSTKIAVYKNEQNIFNNTINHDSEDLKLFSNVIEQKDYRKNLVFKSLINKGIDLEQFAAVVARGGLLRPVCGGTFRVNDLMITDLRTAKYGEHAANLGAIIADEIAKDFNIPAYIVDPVVVDELNPIVRVTGLPEIKRRSIFHALNHKSVARKIANELGLGYEDANFIICHMGGGISVGVHQCGKVIDVNDGLDGEGPFTPERSGSLPVGELISLCFSGKMSEKEIRSRIVGGGGLVAYLGTNNAKEVEKMIANGDDYAAFIYDAMAYQIAKEIGKCSVVLKGNIDAIILTGGLAYSDFFIEKIINHIDWIADVKIYPGEDELYALATGALRVLNGEDIENKYIMED